MQVKDTPEKTCIGIFCLGPHILTKPKEMWEMMIGNKFL